MTKKEINKVIKVAEGLDWSVTYDSEDNELSFQRFSGAGQDFNLEGLACETLTALVNEIWGNYEDFDCSEAAYIWLDNTGHGKNGAPYEMCDVYDDMKECEEEIRKLYNALRELL